MSPNTGICVNGVDQSLQFCFGDTWKGIYALIVYVVSLLQQRYKNKALFSITNLKSGSSISDQQKKT